MSRGLTSRKDCVAAIRLCLLSDLGRIDHWTGSFDLGDETIAKLLEARIALQEAIMCVSEAENLMTDEEG